MNIDQVALLSPGGTAVTRWHCCYQVALLLPGGTAVTRWHCSGFNYHSLRHFKAMASTTDRCPPIRGVTIGGHYCTYRFEQRVEGHHIFTTVLTASSRESRAITSLRRYLPLRAESRGPSHLYDGTYRLEQRVEGHHIFTLVVWLAHGPPP